MNVSSRLIRVLLLETDAHVTTPVINILHARSALKVFDLVVTSTLGDAFREISKDAPDLILTDLDPSDDDELLALARLRGMALQIPIVALLADRSKESALKTLEKGVQSYLLASQVKPDELAAMLLRTMERHAADRALKESEERLRMLIEQASDIIFVLDKAGVVTYAGPSTERLLRIREADLVGKNLFDFVHRDDRLSFMTVYDQAFSAGPALPTNQFRFRLSDGKWMHLEGQGRVAVDAHGKSVCILNSHDITHRVKMEEELRALSLKDELTGLHNRRSFITCLDQQLKQAHRAKNSGIYLLFMDLDGFKHINDNFGHKEGDRVLVESARILKSTFRDADLVARLGGDEFVVFLSDELNGTQVESLKRRLQVSVEAWNNRENRPYRLAMSVGAVHHDLKTKRTVEDLLDDADDLMYQQKRKKKLESDHPAGAPLPESLSFPAAHGPSSENLKN